MLTVVICTYNGSDTIGRTLDAFCQLHPPSGGWKLVIIDNASSDSTPEIIREFTRKLPLTIIQEPRPGQTLAQNTGISHVEGDFAIFSDDDILPDPNWLVEWCRVIDRFPEIDIFGGTIEPEFERPPPAYIQNSGWMGMLYAVTDRTLPEGPVAPQVATIYGPNMGFRSSLLERGHRFDSRLMAGPSPLLGNETDFVDRARKAGSSIGFAPSARVRHIVNKTQITWRWILKRFYRHGRTIYFLENAPGSRQSPKLFGAPRYLFRRLLTLTINVPWVLMTFNRARLLAHLRLIAYDLGAVHQAREMHFARSPTSPR